MESFAPVCLYLDLEKGKSAKLEVVARAALAWADAVKELAYAMDPLIDLDIELISGSEGSLNLNTRIRYISKIASKSPKFAAIIVTSLTWFSLQSASYTHQKILDFLLSDKSPPIVREMSRSEIENIAQEVINALEKKFADAERRQIFAELDKDRSIIGVGSVQETNTKPDFIIPRSQFIERSSDQRPALDIEQTRRTSEIPDLDEERRRLIASRSDMRPEIFFHLVQDKSRAVRRALAANPGAGVGIDNILARDNDAAVRADLAAKLTRPTSSLRSPGRDGLDQATMAIIDMLARDSFVMVRQAVAEGLRDWNNAPAHLISLLARDPELAVAGPILQSSPILTDLDLLSIISNPPAHGALSAISKRTRLTTRVTDAIVGADDVNAIAVLLYNSSAQIRWDTLDLLIDRAGDRVVWHHPLVHRARLPNAAVLKIARFVASDLLNELAARGDIDVATRAQLVKMVSDRLPGKAPRSPVASSAAPSADTAPKPMPLQEAGALSDQLLLEAVRYGDRAFLLSAIAARTGLQMIHVQRALERRNPRAIVALAIRGRLPAQLAVDIQIKLAQVPPGSVISPIVGRHGETWRMTPEEAELEIELLQR